MKTGNLKLMAGASIDNLRGIRLASDPELASLVAGQEAWIWYNNAEKIYKYFDGTEIKPLAGEGGSAPDLTGLVRADGTVPFTADAILSSADQTASVAAAAVSKGYVAGLLARKLGVSEEGALASDLSAGGFGISDLSAPVNPTDAARKIDIENALAGLNWQEDIDGVQIDATLQPQKVEGRRYVLTNVATLHADFGTIAGAANNDIVQYRGTEFEIVFTATAPRAEGAIAWNSVTDQYVRFDGTVWSNFGGMSAVTNGLGLDLVGNEMSVRINATGGLGLDAGGVNVKLDGASLGKSADGLRVANGGIGFAQLAAATFGTGFTRNTGSSTYDLDTTAIKTAGFIDADGGSVATLLLTGVMQETDNAVPNKKYVDDLAATGSQTYVLDGSAAAPATTFAFNHKAGVRFGTVTVYDAAGETIIPDMVKLVDADNLTVTLAEATAAIIVFVAGTNKYVA